MKQQIVRLCVVLSVSFGAAVSAAAPVSAVTRPSDDVTLSFILPGRVASVPVKEGQTVTKGQVLVQLDDKVEQMSLELARKALQAGEVRIEARRAQAEQAVVDLEMTRDAAKGGGATPLQVQHKELEAKIAAVQVRLEEVEQQRAALEVARMERELERMAIISPVDGTVEQLFVREGESVDKLMKVVRVVNTKRLRLEFAVPLGIGRSLTTGSPAIVHFPGDPAPTSNGTVRHVRAEADSRSDTIMVQVEAPNDGNRKAGENVHVAFPAAGAVRTGQAEATETKRPTDTGKEKPHG